MKYLILHCNGTKDNKPLSVSLLCAIDVDADKLQVTEVIEITEEEYNKEGGRMIIRIAKEQLILELVLDRMDYMGLTTYSPNWSKAEKEIYEELWIKFERLIHLMMEEE